MMSDFVKDLNSRPIPSLSSYIIFRIWHFAPQFLICKQGLVNHKDVVKIRDSKDVNILAQLHTKSWIVIAMFIALFFFKNDNRVKERQKKKW
jgi:hypothetical protein